jgi:hypothetical protein
LGTTLDILGTNFTPGGTVTVGGVAATNVTVVAPDHIQAVFGAGLPVGQLSAEFTDSFGGRAILLDALTVVATCVAASPPPAAPVAACATTLAVNSQASRVVITVTWEEPLFIPWFSGSSSPTLTLTAKQIVFCQNATS